MIGDYDVFDSDIAAIVARDAPAGGADGRRPDAAGHDRRRDDAGRLREGRGARDVEDRRRLLRRARPAPGRRHSGRRSTTPDPSVKLFAASSLATPAFVAAAGGAAAETYVTSPVLELDQYPPAAAAVLRAYGTAYHTPGTAYSLYGYEAMSAILDSIRAAGPLGSGRAAVVREFFSLRNRDSVLGRYSITPTGDTTLANMAGYTVDSSGRLHSP